MLHYLILFKTNKIQNDIFKNVFKYKLLYKYNLTVDWEKCLS